MFDASNRDLNAMQVQLPAGHVLAQCCMWSLSVLCHEDLPLAHGNIIGSNSRAKIGKGTAALAGMHAPHGRFKVGTFIQSDRHASAQHIIMSNNGIK